MSTKNHPYRYNYQALDQMLAELYDPKEVGNKLDEIMAEQVLHAAQDEGCRDKLGEHHFFLKMFRDIFWWKLPKQ